jgi:hypothetical protein
VLSPAHVSSGALSDEEAVVRGWEETDVLDTHDRPVDDVTHWHGSGPGRAWLAARFAGALALLAVGAVHLQQYIKLYSAVPTIGALFVLTFVATTILAAALLMPLERWGRRWGRLLVVLAGSGGVALAAGTFVMLTISEHMPLFGFREPGYDPPAIAASRAAEVAAVVLIGAYLVARLLSKRPIARW